MSAKLIITGRLPSRGAPPAGEQGERGEQSPGRADQEGAIPRDSGVGRTDDGGQVHSPSPTCPGGPDSDPGLSPAASDKALAPAPGTRAHTPSTPLHTHTRTHTALRIPPNLTLQSTETTSFGSQEGPPACPTPTVPSEGILVAEWGLHSRETAFWQFRESLSLTALQIEGAPVAPAETTLFHKDLGELKLRSNQTEQERDLGQLPRYLDPPLSALFLGMWGGASFSGKTASPGGENL